MPTPNARPEWQRNPVFKFFASLKLAVVLLAVIIVASIAGTIWESSFNAKVARAYVYGAPWFNLWLLLLVANLTASALSRWPWKRHHVAFLVTHLGIITLLFGSLIGRIWGIEGTITLFEGEPPSNRLLVDERQLRVRDTDGIIKGYPAEFINRPPSPERPRILGPLASGAQLSLVDYAPAMESKLSPRPTESGGVPAVHFTVATAMMGQKLESWLLAEENHAEHSTFNMGLAAIELKRGTAPGANGAAAPANETTGDNAVEIEESIFAFAKAPEQQVAKALKGGSTGAKVVLSQPTDGDKGTVTITIGDRQWSHAVAPNLGKDVALENSPFTMRMEAYWPDFRIQAGKPTSISEEPNNAAVVVTLRGRAVPATTTPTDPHGSEAAIGAGNKLTLYVADDGALTYELLSRKNGRSSGALAQNTALETGWADWQLTVDQVLPQADHWMDFRPLPKEAASPNVPEGVKVRVEQNGKVLEQWVPSGWQVMMPTEPQAIQVSLGWRQIPLPIGLELLDFEVERNEGSNSPAGFKSTVRVTDREGRIATGQCWMNNPFNHPGNWWNTWSGLTFKMSQASWNPENLSQSTIQILRDPGWLLKWVGSLLICAGIFMLFYVKRFRRPSSRAVPPVDSRPRPAPEPELAVAEQ